MSRYSNGALFAVVVAILLQIYFRNFKDPSFVRRTRAPTLLTGTSGNDNYYNNVRYICDGSSCSYRNSNSTDVGLASDGSYPCSLSDNSVWAFGDIPFNAAPRISSNWGWRSRIVLGRSYMLPLFAGWIGFNGDKGLKGSVGWANVTYTADTLYVQLISINGCPMFCKISIYAEFQDLTGANYDDFTVFGSKPSSIRNPCEVCISDKNEEDGGASNANSNCMQSGMCGCNGVPTKCTSSDTGNVLFKIDMKNVPKGYGSTDVFFALRTRYSKKACQCIPILVTQTVTGPTSTTTETATSWSTVTVTSVSISTSISMVTYNNTVTQTVTSPTTISNTITSFIPTIIFIPGVNTTVTTTSTFTSVSVSVSVSLVEVVSTLTKTMFLNEVLTIVVDAVTVTQSADCGTYTTWLTMTVPATSILVTETRDSHNSVLPITIPASSYNQAITTLLRGAVATCTATVNMPAITTTKTVTLTVENFNTITVASVSVSTVTFTVTTTTATPFYVYFPGSTITVTETEKAVTSTYTTTYTTTVQGTPMVLTTTRYSTETVYRTETKTITVSPTSTLVYPSQIPTCVNFGSVADVNAYISGDYQGSSDVEGRLVVGGNAEMAAGMSVGAMLTEVDECREIVFVVGGKLTSWPSGRLYFGSANFPNNSSAIATSILTQADYAVCQNYYNPNFFDFNLANSRLVTLSTNLAALPITTNWTVTFTEMSITLAGGLSMEIIDVPDGSTFLAAVKTVRLSSNYKAGSLLIFNIHGQTSGFKGGNLEALKDVNVLFNFFEATTLTIDSVAVRGWILAPLATATGAQGVVWGSVFMKKLTGSIQINLRQIPLCTTREQAASAWHYQALAATDGTSGAVVGIVGGDVWLMILMAVFFMDFVL